jgi:sulfur relay (sulfurtransferase) complex TusBCD TusD component (DsrE family)
MCIVDLEAAVFFFRNAYDIGNKKVHPNQQEVAKYPKLCAWVENVMKPEISKCIMM